MSCQLQLLGWAVLLVPLVALCVYTVGEWKKSEVQREHNREMWKAATSLPVQTVRYPAFIQLRASRALAYEDIGRMPMDEIEDYARFYQKELVQAIRHAIPLQFKFELNRYPTSLAQPTYDCYAQISVADLIKMGDDGRDVSFYLSPDTSTDLPGLR